MATSYNAQIDNKNGKYSIQFETGNYEYFKLVEKACQETIDKSNKAVKCENCFYYSKFEMCCTHPKRSYNVVRYVGKCDCKKFKRVKENNNRY